jgi:hypothetical protein
VVGLAESWGYLSWILLSMITPELDPQSTGVVMGTLLTLVGEIARPLSIALDLLIVWAVLTVFLSIVDRFSGESSGTVEKGPR